MIKHKKNEIELINSDDEDASPQICSDDYMLEAGLDWTVHEIDKVDRDLLRAYLKLRNKKSRPATFLRKCAGALTKREGNVAAASHSLPLSLHARLGGTL